MSHNKWDTKTISVHRITIQYDRPHSVRDVPLKHGSNRGFIPSLKSYHGEKVIFQYESTLEADLLYILDHDPNCIDLQTQPFEIDYITKTGKTQRFYPDIWTIYSDGTQYLYEVKPEHALKKLTKDENWHLRIAATEKFCEKHDMKFMIMTEDKIRCVRLENIKDLLVAAKHYSPSKCRINLHNLNNVIHSCLSDNGANLRDLASHVSALTQLKFEEAVSILKYKIYFGDLLIDWNIPLEDAEITLTKNKGLPIPSYALPLQPPKINPNSGDYNPELTDSNQSPILSKNDRQIFTERKDLIAPIINKWGNEAKKSQIKEYAEQTSQSFPRLYRWYLRWNKEGDSCFYPSCSKKHIKPHFDPKVEKIMMRVINEWNTGEFKQIKKAYTEFCYICNKNGLKPVTYKTFWRRIKEMPASEKRGKFRPRTLKNIPRGLSGTYQGGKYPGYMIQMDHTELDIWLIDQFTKEPYKRPHLTLGVDVSTGSIWGWFLSFDAPSQESVMNCIYNGIIDKKDTELWEVFTTNQLKKGINPENFQLPGSGFPAILQVDNGKDFRAERLKQFCMENNITLEYRPVRDPEYGGFVESVWDTCNDAIRNEGLPGRGFPIAKFRKTPKNRKYVRPVGYDPKKEASLTFDDFNEWFAVFMITHYSRTLRAEQLHCPNDLWIQGIKGAMKQRLGGALRLLHPSEYEQYTFDIKRSLYLQLSRHGFRHKNMYYSSKWLRDARKNQVLKDGAKYRLRISYWDIRYIYIVDPNSKSLETLEVYKYSGDKRINDYLLQGLGMIPGKKPFLISLNMVKTAKEYLQDPIYDVDNCNTIFQEMNKNIIERGKHNKKEQILTRNLSKSKAGRQKITQAVLVAEMDEGQIDAKQEESDKLGRIGDFDDSDEFKIINLGVDNNTELDLFDEDEDDGVIEDSEEWSEENTMNFGIEDNRE